MKPPYQLPTMADIAEVKGTNGYKVLSTFSGCGGSCLGLEMAGFEIIFASEFIPAAQETYVLNHPGVPVSGDDIRDVEPELLLAYLGLEVGELDVLEGSPPCASFSTAGKGAAGWSANETFRQRIADGEPGAPPEARGETKKYSDTETAPPDDLFLEYVRLAKAMQPKVLIAENVSGLSKGNAIGYFKMIHRALEDAGYVLHVRLLDAQYLNVPQQRVRTIFVGVRKDLAAAHGVKPAFPATHYPSKAKGERGYVYSLREALGLAASTRLHQRIGGQNVELPIGDDPAPSITANGLGGTSNRGGEGELIIGVEYDERRGHGAREILDEPAHTILAGGDAARNQTDHQVRVVHDSSGGKHFFEEGRVNDYSKGDVTDEPSPTITVGVGGLNSSHWIVEEPSLCACVTTEEGWRPCPPNLCERPDHDHEVVAASARVGHGYTEKEISLDEPAYTVMTDEAYSPDLEVRGIAMVPKGRDHSFAPADEPAPTVMAEGIGDVRQYQAMVEGGEPLDCQHEFLEPPESQQCIRCGINKDELAAITMDGYAIGREWDKLGVGEQSDKYLNLVRPDPAHPSPTVTQTAGQQGAAGVTHPTQRRKFTIQELKAVCGFPADFVLTGSYRQQWERLGRAVPPPMMAAVGEVVAREILDRVPR